MESGPYIVGAVVLGALSVAFLVAVLVRIRRADRSDSESVFTTRGRRSGANGGATPPTRSLAEMLHYYAPHDEVGVAEAHTHEAARGEKTTPPSVRTESVAEPVPHVHEMPEQLPSALLSVRVHSATVPAPPSGYSEGQLLAPLPAPEPQPDSSEGVDDSPPLVMGAPVEVWFEDARMGVKAGSETHERFRKCADTLLHDLKAARSDSR